MRTTKSCWQSSNSFHSSLITILTDLRLGTEQFSHIQLRLNPLEAGTTKEKNWGTFNKQFKSLCSKSFFQISYMKYNDMSRSQICTCHKRWAVVTCAKLWPDWIIRIKIGAKLIATRFQFWAHKWFVKWVPHYTDVIMATMVSRITSLMVVYSTFIQTQIKENIKAPRHWPLCGEFTGTSEFPAQRASYAENVSIWWRHHEVKNAGSRAVFTKDWFSLPWSTSQLKMVIPGQLLSVLKYTGD